MSTQELVAEEGHFSATPVDHELKKTLRWWDGFAISLSIPAALFIGIGYAIGAIGAIPAIILSTIAAIFAALQNNIYAELASMFPQKSGGIAMYANEGWKNKSVLAGPVAAFGYWFAWASSLAIYSLQIGSLIQAQWFADVTWRIQLGGVTLGLEHLIALAVLFMSWGFNMLGIRLAMGVVYATGVLIMIPIVVFALAPVLGVGWTPSNLTADWSAGGFPVWQAIVAWALIQAWSVYGIEAVATFTPEFKNSARDARRGLRLAGIFCVLVYALVPLGVGGLMGQPEIANNPVSFYVVAFNQMFGSGGFFMTVCIIAGLVLLMVMTTADGGRVLHGCAENGLTVKQLAKINRFGVPGRAMTMDLVLNILLLVFVGSTLAVIVAGLIGIIVCHVLALSGYVMLRRSNLAPNRETKLGPIWPWIAGILAVVNLAVLVLGSLNAHVTGYGGPPEILLGLAVLSVSIILYVYRRVVQDRQPLRWRDPSPVDIAPEAQ